MYGKLLANSPPRSIRYLYHELRQAITAGEFELGMISVIQNKLQRECRRSSPSITIQRAIRGFIFLRSVTNYVDNMRRRAICVQRYTRGFLFRKKLKADLTHIVGSIHKKPELLHDRWEGGTFDIYIARCGFRRLVPGLRSWCRRAHMKRRAKAIQAIQNWCARWYKRYHVDANEQRHVYDGNLRIYYPSSFHSEVVKIAMIAARQDTILTTLTEEERVRFITSRFLSSDIRVLRNTTSFVRTRVDDQVRVRALNALLLRRFRADRTLEFELLEKEINIVQRDSELVRKIISEHKIYGNDGSTDEHDKVSLHTKQQQASTQKYLQAVIEKLKCLSKKSEDTFITPAIYIAQPIEPDDTCEGDHKELCSSARNGCSSTYSKLKVFIAWNEEMYKGMVSSFRARILMAQSRNLAVLLSARSIYCQCAAIAIQASWKASLSSRAYQLRRRIRSINFIQKWWRFQVGLKRRLAYVRDCVLLYHSIQSRHLYMEASLFSSLVDSRAWDRIVAVQPKFPQKSVSYTISERGNVLLRNNCTADKNSQQPVFQLRTSLPASLTTAWQYDAEAVEASTISEILTAHVKAVRVNLRQEVTQEIHLLYEVDDFQHKNFSFDLDIQHLSTLSLAEQLTYMSSEAMQLAAHLMRHHQLVPDYKVLPLSSTPFSFVRLTFTSTQEARHRALLLLAETYNFGQKTYARLYSIMSLVVYGVVRDSSHKSQVGRYGEMWRKLNELVPIEFPSKWWLDVYPKLTQSVRPLSGNLYHRNLPLEPNITRQLKRLYRKRFHHCLPTEKLISSSNENVRSIKPWGHLCSDQVPKGEHTVDLKKDKHCASPIKSRSRHEILCSTFHAKSSKGDQRPKRPQAEPGDKTRMMSSFRVERDRAMIALVADETIIQSEKAAEAAATKLEIQIKLQKAVYERQQERLIICDRIEHHKNDVQCAKLVKQFESTFTSQIGAVARLSTQQKKKERIKKEDETRVALRVQRSQQKSSRDSRRKDAINHLLMQKRRSKIDTTKDHMYAYKLQPLDDLQGIIPRDDSADMLPAL